MCPRPTWTQWIEQATGRLSRRRLIGYQSPPSIRSQKPPSLKSPLPSKATKRRPDSWGPKRFLTAPIPPHFGLIQTAPPSTERTLAPAKLARDQGEWLPTPGRIGSSTQEQGSGLSDDRMKPRRGAVSAGARATGARAREGRARADSCSLTGTSALRAGSSAIALVGRSPRLVGHARVQLVGRADPVDHYLGVHCPAFMGTPTRHSAGQVVKPFHFGSSGPDR